jgi:hypothetical protein
MKRGVVVSDLHCGSIYGMLPPQFETFDGTVKLQNAGQDCFWKCWPFSPGGCSGSTRTSWS